MERKNKGFTPLETKISNWESNRGSKRFLTGFTIVELLTAVAIVALLIGILLPALTYVRNTAKETMQKAQLGTIELALTAFKNDYGEYPPSQFEHPTPPPCNYCGAQKLAEALLGWDLLGFHPKSAWRADGLDENGGKWTYDPCGVRGDATLNERKGPYLETATARVFRLGDLFSPRSTAPLDPYPFVLCDVFGVKKITLANETVNAGTPILYYRANTSSKTISAPAESYNRIYDYKDNIPLISLGRVTDGATHPLAQVSPYIVFYGDPTVPTLGYIQDPRVTAPPWPYRPDSYILISAGVDGLYGTADDITNF